MTQGLSQIVMLPWKKEKESKAQLQTCDESGFMYVDTGRLCGLCLVFFVGTHMCTDGDGHGDSLRSLERVVQSGKFG